ncbi:hypothetical protein J4217_01210 [Candidatus Pacearchaeota archaeon]|nr:hypothetical protein [Candidatus Pacearchaeota archaeon]
MHQQIVLERRNPEPNDAYKFASSFIFYNPLRDDIYNKITIATPDQVIDGHYLTIAFNGFSLGIPIIGNVVGIIDRREDVEQRTYDLAKRLAQARAENESYGWYHDKRGVPFVDNIQEHKKERLELVPS